MSPIPVLGWWCCWLCLPTFMFSHWLNFKLAKLSVVPFVHSKNSSIICFYIIHIYVLGPTLNELQQHHIERIPRHVFHTSHSLVVVHLIHLWMTILVCWIILLCIITNTMLRSEKKKRVSEFYSSNKPQKCILHVIAPKQHVHGHLKLI